MKFEEFYSLSAKGENGLCKTFSEARATAFRKAKETKSVIGVHKLAFLDGEFIEKEGSSITVMWVNGKELYK